MINLKILPFTAKILLDKLKRRTTKWQSYSLQQFARIFRGMIHFTSTFNNSGEKYIKDFFNLVFT